MSTQEDKSECFAKEQEPGRAGTAGGLRCPQCQSVRVRHRGLPLLLNWGVCCVLGASACLGIPLKWGLFWVLLVAFYTLPVTACVALVGRHRCLDCGRWFRSARAVETKETAPGFPWRFYVIGLVLLLLLLGVVGPAAIRIGTGGSRRADFPTVVNTALLLALALWAGLLWQVALHFVLRRKLRSAFIWAGLFALPALLAGGWSLYRSLPAVQVRAILPVADLASLPGSAKKVKVCRYWWPDEVDAFVRFRADSEDMGEFLDASPALWGAEWDTSAPWRVASPLDRTGPAWYREGIRGADRCCSVRAEKSTATVTVSVTADDEAPSVYISIVWLD